MTFWRGMIYAVCTSCAFLRAFSREGQTIDPPDRCPACGGELQLHRNVGRFPPAYLSRVSLDLHGAPPLDRSTTN